MAAEAQPKAAAVHYERYLCLHGHFYQPPRENPWLDAVETEDSASPYHDWNDRITAECYGPNTAARISTWDGHILDIRNNYTRISFNFGPTLLHWMEANRPEIYGDIIDADRISRAMRGGHGNAIAQPYNHTILPLATDRERLTQVIWGLEDFRERFGRDPEGVWLPECAVDLKTLDCLASNGVKFTILAPRQAKAFRDLKGSAGWESADGGRIDPTRPYLCTLPSGASIVLFFYDGPISQAVAFEGLLNDGATFAQRLMSGFSGQRNWNQLLHIATDGESYGHHHKHGEMALAYALHLFEKSGAVKLTNYGEYLSKFPPAHEAQIHENSSWSCVHGVERWRSDCGCKSGRQGGWHQKWRGPLREAFRYLADKAGEVFDREAQRFFRQPERMLLSYVRVLLSRGSASFADFLREHQRAVLEPEQEIEALRLLEIMRNAQLLFTSCAWFFDEVSGLETVQTMKYAGRMLQLLRPYAPNAEGRFLHMLEKAVGNNAEAPNGADCYRKWVKPMVVDLHRVVAHHCLATFDRTANGFHQLFCFEVHERDAAVSSFGATRLKLARVSVRSLMDGEEIDTVAAVLHFGGHDFRCSITGSLGFTAFEDLKADLMETYRRHSLTDLVRAVDHHFGRQYFGLAQMFTEGRRELLQRITLESFQRFDDSIRMIYEENRKFMEYLLEMDAPLPQGFLAAAEFVLRGRFLEELDAFMASGKGDAVLGVAREVARFRLKLDDPLVKRRLEVDVERVFDELAVAPTTALCSTAEVLLETIELLQLRVEIWEAQNIIFALVHNRPLPAHLAHRIPEPRVLHSSIATPLKTLAAKLRVSLEPYDRPAPLSSLAIAPPRREAAKAAKA